MFMILSNNVSSNCRLRQFLSDSSCVFKISWVFQYSTIFKLSNFEIYRKGYIDTSLCKYVGRGISTRVYV